LKTEIDLSKIISEEKHELEDVSPLLMLHI
jgi:hypothetical protein